MNYQELWEDLCDDANGFKTSDLEKDFQRDIRHIFRRLGWREHTKSITLEHVVNMGTEKRADIVCKDESGIKFVIEVKRPKERFTENNVEQLSSYMCNKNVRVDVGLLLGYTFRIYYDKEKMNLICDIPFDKDSKNGETVLSLFLRENFSADTISKLKPIIEKSKHVINKSISKNKVTSHTEYFTNLKTFLEQNHYPFNMSKVPSVYWTKLYKIQGNSHISIVVARYPQKNNILVDLQIEKDEPNRHLFNELSKIKVQLIEEIGFSLDFDDKCGQNADSTWSRIKYYVDSADNIEEVARVALAFYNVVVPKIKKLLV